MKSVLDKPQSSMNTVKVQTPYAEGTHVPLRTFQNDTDVVPRLVFFASPSHPCQEVLAMGKRDTKTLPLGNLILLH